MWISLALIKMDFIRKKIYHIATKYVFKKPEMEDLMEARYKIFGSLFNSAMNFLCYKLA